jgi:hypothetical protein
VRHAVFWSAVAAAAASASIALAATLSPITATKIGAGNTAVFACDTDGFTHSYTTSGGNVTAITIGGIADPACEAGSLRATVTNSAGGSIASAGPQTIATDGDTLDNSMTLSTSPQPLATLVAGIHIVVEGP